MWRVAVLISALSIVILTSACATITRGTSDTLVIETDPPSAHATLSNGLQCKTPCSLKMPRKEACVVKIDHGDDHEPVEVNVTPQISGAGGAGMAGNVLLGGLIGAAVDAGSGAMYDLKPNPISVKLVKKVLPVNDSPASSPEAAVAVSSQPTLREKTLIERLQELNTLKEKELISDQEYSRQREKILASKSASVAQRLQDLQECKEKSLISEDEHSKYKEQALIEL